VSHTEAVLERKVVQHMTSTIDAPVTTTLSPDYTERARTVARVVEREANTIESDATITSAVYDALVEQELFWLLVPTEFGGGGKGIVEALKVIEEISRADGSTGWALMANAFSTGVAVGFMNDVGAREMFDGPARGITAGMIMPTGKAVRVDGGYRVTGKFQFGSGSAHASWIGAGFVVHDDAGNPVLDANGGPDCRIGFLPRTDVEFLGNWDVMGMVGTGSYDYLVDDVFVPDRFTMETFSTVPVRPEPVYKLGLLGIGVGGHAPVALGIATRALEEVVRIASKKNRPGYDGAVGESQLFLRDFAKNEALLQAARAYVYQAHGDAEDSARRGEDITDEQRARLRQVTTWVQEVAGEIVQFAHRWAGSQAIRNPSALGRCSRDIAVATQHMLVDQISLVEAAKAIVPGYDHRS
jgi:alkylation response protein AidB-like acyl-CoA dehydrogenase